MERILVVDDDDCIRGIVSEVLVEEGHEVDQASSAEEALALYDPARYALVITDIRMSGLDGLGLLERLRTMEPDAHVVIMTSHASVESAVQALKQGAYDFIVKPFESLDIISTVAERALGNVRLVRERTELIATLQRSNAELEKLNRFFRELAVRDGLTGLYNHRHLHEVLHQEVERAERYSRPLSIAFIDVDHFKQYNDTFGHQKGDEVLRMLAELFTKNVREMDVVARWGGEEFVIVAPETSAEDCVRMAEKLRKAVAECPVYGREELPGGHLTISIGVAGLSAGGTSEKLIHRADSAAYEAKGQGRNMVTLAA